MTKHVPNPLPRVLGVLILWMSCWSCFGDDTRQQRLRGNAALSLEWLRRLQDPVTTDVYFVPTVIVEDPTNSSGQSGNRKNGVGGTNNIVSGSDVAPEGDEGTQETPTLIATDPPVKAVKKSSPTKAPTEVPSEATQTTPTKAPVKAAKTSPVKEATETPVSAATETPVKATTKAPVKPTKAPTKTTKAPVKATTKAPVKVTTEAPTGTPTIGDDTDAPVTKDDINDGGSESTTEGSDNDDDASQVPTDDATETGMDDIVGETDDANLSMPTDDTILEDEGVEPPTIDTVPPQPVQTDAPTVAPTVLEIEDDAVETVIPLDSGDVDHPEDVKGSEVITVDDDSEVVEDEELEGKLQREEKEARRLGGFGFFLALVAMVFTAHQMSENPDGIYASICRLVITISGCGIKMVVMPFRSMLGGRYHGGHMPVSTMEYREPYRGSHHMMELS